MPDNIYILILISVVGIVLLIAGTVLLQIKNQNRLLLKQKQIAAAETAHQKDLLHAIIQSQELERKRIGSDLHDEVGSVLSSLRILIETNVLREDNFGKQSKAIIDRVIVSVRQISHNLSPRMAGAYGFYDAVHELCDTVRSSGVISVILDFTEEQMPVSLDPNTAMGIYRVLAELINNTIKHAKAKKITMVIGSADNNMRVAYQDDGTGFAINDMNSNKGMGMQNIESRLTMMKAKWAFPDHTTKGFSIIINIPLVQ